MELIDIALTIAKAGITVLAYLAAYGILGKIAYIERGYEAAGGEVIAAVIFAAAMYLLSGALIEKLYLMVTKKTSNRDMERR